MILCHCRDHYVLCWQQVTLSYNATNKYWFSQRRLCRIIFLIKSLIEIIWPILWQWCHPEAPSIQLVVSIKQNISNFPQKPILLSYCTSSYVKSAHFRYVSWPNNDVWVTTFCALGVITMRPELMDVVTNQKQGTWSHVACVLICVYKSRTQVNYSFFSHVSISTIEGSLSWSRLL